MPFAEHVAGVAVIVGVDGCVNCAAILKEELADDVHEPLLAVRV